MKNKFFKISAFFVWIALTLVSCTAEEQFSDDKLKITFEKGDTDFDRYLKHIFVKPYNIEYLYKWKDIESNRNYTLTPANYANSVKMANLLKYLCLDAYDEVSPDDFLKKYFPKNIVLSGSFAHNSNGTILLGTAEGGLKITLYGINELNPTNVANLYEYYFRTIFHEFSHILHQTIDISTDFKKISATDYVGDSWNETNNTPTVALQKGFISTYSRKNEYEDFVEIIAYYITYTDAEWSAKLTTAGTTGAPIITKKLDIVKQYLKTEWKLDLEALRNQVQTRAANINSINLDNISY